MKRRLAFLVLCALALVACITINVYFPEAAIKDLSEQIEKQIEKQAAGEQAEPAPEPAPEPQARWYQPAEDILLAVLDLGASTAWAQEGVPSPEISNPAIRKIIDSRAKRLDALNRFKATGVIGENNRALAEIRSLEKLGDLRQRAELQRLVRDENTDREQLFKEIAAAKNVDLSQLPRIRATYAETLRGNARPGDWIQLPDGTWQQK